MTKIFAPVVTVSLIVLSTCVLFAPLVRSAFTAEARFLEWDVPEQYWPDQVYLCGALHDGELPYWNPYDRAGYPYYADPQSGAYHPLSWAICALGGRTPSLGWAELRVVLGFFMAGAFGLLWLRRYRLPWGAALLGAIAIQTAPFMRHNWELNLTTALAYLPLMLWAADRAAVERRPRDGALLALALSLCVWVGSPPALWFAVTYTACFWLVRLLGEVRVHGREALMEGLKVALVAAVLTGGLSFVVLVPGALLAEHSIQAGRSFDSIADGGLSLDQLWALVTPQPGNHLYMGLVVVVLVPVAFLTRKRTRIPARWFFAVMAVIAVAMTLGAQGPLFRIAFDWVPGVSTFRLPHRYEAWLGPSLGILAAAGLAGLLRVGPKALRGELPGIAVGAVLSAVLLMDVSQSLPSDRHTRPGPHPGGEASAEGVLATAPQTEHGYRYMDEFGISCRSGTRFGRRDFRGYQDPLLLKSYERVMAALGEHPQLLEQFNVRYVLTGPHFIHGWRRHYLPRPEVLRRELSAVDLGNGVYELPGALPLAYWVRREQTGWFHDRPHALQHLLAVAPTPVALFDRGGRPVSQPGENGFLAGSTKLVAGRDIRLERDRLSFRIDVPDDEGTVVINEAWYPGWRATVDGQQAHVHQVNALVRGLRVDAGDHEIEMAFRPREGVVLRVLWVMSVIVCAMILSLGFRLKRAG